MVTTFTYTPSLVMIDERSFELSWSHTHTPTNKQTGPITIHCAAASVQCNESLCTSENRMFIAVFALNRIRYFKRLSLQQISVSQWSLRSVVIYLFIAMHTAAVLLFLLNNANCCCCCGPKRFFCSKVHKRFQWFVCLIELCTNFYGSYMCRALFPLNVWNVLKSGHVL